MNEKDYVPVSLQGNGTTKEIAYQWKTFDKTDLIVELESITSGELTTLELGSDYDVNVEAIGGNIILTTAPTSDYFIKVSRKVPNYQSKGFSTSPGFQGSEIEKSFDKVSCCLQDMDYNISKFKEDFSDEVNQSIDDYQDETQEAIADFTSEINSKIELVNSAAQKLTQLDEILDDCEELNEQAQSALLSTQQKANEAQIAAQEAQEAASAAASMLDVDLEKLSATGENVIDTRIDNKIESLSDIVNFNDITSLISFSSAVLTISSGLCVQIPNGLSVAGEDGTSESQYLSYTLANTVTKTYTTSSSNSVLTIDNQGEVHEYLSYSESATEPTGSAPLIYLNTTDNKMYKKLSAEDTFIQCFEAKIADGFTRGEDGTITAINSLISPIVALSADTVHTAQIKVNALLNLPELENDNNFVNTMLEFTLSENCSLALPGTVTYSGGEPPEIAADGVTVNRLIFDTTTGGDNWCCYYSSLSTSQNSSDESETEAV